MRLARRRLRMTEDADHLSKLAKVHRVLLKIEEEHADLATDIGMIRCSIAGVLDALITDATDAYRQELQWSKKLDFANK
jgi:hypothetical protein